MNTALHRNNTRLRDYDYASSGAHLVTICTAQRAHLFGEIVDGEIILDDVGQIALEEDASRLVHAAAVLRVGASGEIGSAKKSLGAFIANFTAAVTKRARAASSKADLHIWQRGYHDYVVRNTSDLERIRTYISTNPLEWHLDEYAVAVAA